MLGAAGTVTGSCFLLACGNDRPLVDCGLFQGSRTLESLNREPFAFDPGELGAVLLAHAHLVTAGCCQDSSPRVFAALSDARRRPPLVRRLDTYSAHADQGELVEWILTRKLISGSLFLTHGESEATQALRKLVEGRDVQVIIPEIGEVYELPHGAPDSG